MSLSIYPVYVVAILLGAFSTAAWAPPKYQPVILVTLVCVALLLGIFYLQKFTDFEPFEVDSDIPDDLVDPWALQGALMVASDQKTAAHPAITNTSILYAALIMEESAETFRALAAALLRAPGDTDTVFFFSLVATKLIDVANLSEDESLKIRSLLTRWGQEFCLELSEEEAKPIFDGTTDLAVVNCGFALASGLDGSAGYAEVVGSNLSKRNPATGKIDKTPDGKWIKGPNYREPDLVSVMRRTARERAFNEACAALDVPGR